ncbi:RagB/SusD family nutrient uptake outer membrane protein [Pinibacter soli]|uniref:RagB/SusD family nutrient uptake outer membrane protein n=1 Tax=Pinibacter soli TaxID=3044211 RepID=A0ABT6RH60_9BACT|nr:RagB/SusD family nutrient uptake outer membrane protein [Pinibacter soli]MDI3321909.1 RagB/SusD family nutrient uptake outer membrane protein [Pinibacter soli]
MQKRCLINKINIAVPVACLLFIAGCTKGFEKLNTNPNQPTDEMLNWDNVKIGSYFLQMEKNVKPIGTASEATGPVNDYQIAYNLASDNWSGYMAAPQSAKWGSGSNFTTYFFTSNWNDGTFNTMFTKTFEPYLNIRKNVDSAKSPEIVALANIIKIAQLHQATDSYGPMAYDGVGTSLNAPYQSQEVVYNRFFQDLTSAIAVLGNYQKASNSIIPNYDAVYAGNVSKWIRFANSLLLRLAMRLSYANATKAQLYAEQAVNNEYGVITDVADAAQMSQGAGFTFQNPVTTIWNGYADTRIGASILSFLKGYNDPRLTAYVQKPALDTATTYYGVRTGFITGDFTKLSSPNIQLTTPLYWLKASEVAFLRAEGVLRGWNMGNTAANFYKDGIAKSFAENGVSSDAYVNNSTSVPAAYVNPVTPAFNSPAVSSATIAWNETATFEVKLEKIITQKYIATFPNGQEAWSEFRRTGYPKLFPIINNMSGGVVPTATGVKRMPFPSSEYSTNAANVNNAVSNLLGGPDNGGTKVWWDQKN